MQGFAILVFPLKVALATATCLLAQYHPMHVLLEGLCLLRMLGLFILYHYLPNRILEFECNGIEISLGKTANCEVELWDCSGNHK